ncbi:ABC transporter permease [Mycobacterium sp. SMC-4]|uniref:ABC transporter permease n=1 Tax=Mycobacterium sp. SMC-4 TaxID=2857059 RepID=UPI0021B27E4B|nr:ABC transporter permease [Mycobacterium sp. SMC-4]UXA18508.1 ABC transporter permease [Mycobacterium sp. SMC-4]
MTTTQHRHATAGAHQPPAALQATVVVAVLTVLIALVAIAFALPAARSGPHGVPIGAAGPQAAGGQFAQLLEQHSPGAFEVTYFPGDTALRSAIADREVYGGLVLPGQPGAAPTMMIATTASPAVAQLLTQLGATMGQQLGTRVAVEDLAPPTGQDPRGAGLTASALPITLAGLLPAIALVLLLPGRHWTQLAAAMSFAAVSAVTLAAVLRYVLGSIDQNFWAVTAALTLGIGAALLLLLGIGAVFGKAGLIAGALLAVLVGNPLSGLAGAPELLPSGWGELGQLLPQGATATLLRSAAAFGGVGSPTSFGLVGSPTPIIVLSCWALAGIALVAVAALRAGKSASR